MAVSILTGLRSETRFISSDWKEENYIRVALASVEPDRQKTFCSIQRLADVTIRDQTQMNKGQVSGESGGGFSWVFACLAVLLIVGLVAVKPGDLRRRAVSVQIDKNGTARLGGVLPLRDKNVRDVALRVASHLNGGRFTILADKGASFSNIVEVFDGIRKASTNPSPQQRVGPPQRSAGNTAR
jgi:hypothetical protein